MQGTSFTNQRKQAAVRRPLCLVVKQRFLTLLSAVAIETIQEIRSGDSTRSYRVQFKFPENAERKWITIIYVSAGQYKTLHMLADTPDTFISWDTSLRKLFTIRQGLMSGVGNMDLRETVWERQYWKVADMRDDRKLSFQEVECLCWKLNANLPPTEIRRLFDVCQSPFSFVSLWIRHLVTNPLRLQTRRRRTISISPVSGLLSKCLKGARRSSRFTRRFAGRVLASWTWESLRSLCTMSRRRVVVSS